MNKYIIDPLYGQKLRKAARSLLLIRCDNKGLHLVLWISRYLPNVEKYQKSLEDSLDVL
jgi:hypothetical protein